MWHIAKRELYDNLNSLRFALATVLLFGLMLTNAVVHLREHPVRVQKYHDAITESLNRLRAQTDLYEIAQWGPELLHKKPSPLHFCTDGGDIVLPGTIYQSVSRITNDLYTFWYLSYRYRTPNSKNIRPATIKVDWEICDWVRFEPHRNLVHL